MGGNILGGIDRGNCPGRGGGMLVFHFLDFKYIYMYIIKINRTGVTHYIGSDICSTIWQRDAV